MTSREASREIPLLAVSGEVLGHALVDAADAQFLSQRTWRLAPAGYVVRWGKTRSPDRRTVAILMHRVVAGLAPGDPREVDHRNGNKLDNRRSNLRVCTRAENAQNLTRLPKSASPYRGVHRHGERWRAAVRLRGHLHVLGCFDDELEAAEAAAAFRRENMPFADPVPEETHAA